ncbi:MAG: SMP-30/gluconolactonase/LRE family protein [Planctomycetota bacterium]|nr:SMP-30/gluconolactonase/LRE family protein [Planctomycetota bacterium]
MKNRSLTILGYSVVLLVLLRIAPAQTTTRSATTQPVFPVLDQPASTRPDSPIEPGAKLQKLADGFAFTEGPTSDQRGNIFFIDQPNDRIMEWSAEGQLSTFMHPSGYSNGMCFDADGNLITCADEKNELWSITPDKKVTVLVKDYKGKLLNGPNDVWIRPDGGMYLTDPFYKRPWWADPKRPMEQDVQGVYFLSPDRKTLTRVIDDLKQPNGIIGSPDGKTLYVSNIRGGPTYSYTINVDGALSNKTYFCPVGSDGMTIDSDGNIYTTNGRSMQIFDKSGKQLDEIRMRCENVCFGGKDGHLLFITAPNAVYGLQMKTRRVGPQ